MSGSLSSWLHWTGSTRWCSSAGKGALMTLAFISVRSLRCRGWSSAFVSSQCVLVSASEIQGFEEVLCASPATGGKGVYNLSWRWLEVWVGMEVLVSVVCWRNQLFCKTLGRLGRGLHAAGLAWVLFTEVLRNLLHGVNNHSSDPLLYESEFASQAPACFSNQSPPLNFFLGCHWINSVLYLMTYILQKWHIGGVLRCLSATFFQVNECFVFMDLSFMKQRWVWLLLQMVLTVPQENKELY